MFEIFPAVDVSGGRVARMTGGGSDVRLPDDPLGIAEGYARAGATWVHFVDLDAARSGEPGDMGLLRALCGLAVRVQVGGGLCTREAIDAARCAGAHRVVVGTTALADLAAVASMLADLGDVLAVGLDVRHGRLDARGRGGPGISLEVAVDALVEAGCQRLVLTDVERDGTLGGVDAAWVGSVARRACTPVIASGGISGVDDLLTLATIPGVEGAIVGRAIAEGSIDLATALATIASL